MDAARAAPTRCSWEAKDSLTIGGLADGELHPIQRAFIEHDAFQCGYCTPGQIVSAVGMLREAAAGWPSVVSADLAADCYALDDDEIRERMSDNLCRCAAYANIVPAINEAACAAEQGTQEPTRQAMQQEVGRSFVFSPPPSPGQQCASWQG